MNNIKNISNILVIGGTGFIGSHIVAYLLLKNFNVICGVRDIKSAKLKFPSAKIIKFDFNNTTKTLSQDLLGIDIIINVAGILNSTRVNDIKNVHIKGPKALVKAAIKAKVKRIIHISALGIENETETAYSQTKKEFDNFLMSQAEIDWVILRPSLVYAKGCYGGTSLMRGLASMPFIIPLIGNGEQKFQPVHMDDLTNIVEYCAIYYRASVDHKDCEKINKLYDVVGPDIVTVKEILTAFRSQMNLTKAFYIKIPEWLIASIAKFADCIGNGPLSQVSYKMMKNPNIGNALPIIEFTNIKPRAFLKGVETTPLTAESLCYARLFILRPLFKISLSFFWILSGTIPFFGNSNSLIASMSMRLGQTEVLFGVIFNVMCFADIVLGIMLFVKSRLAYLLQIILISLYTVSLTIINSNLWLDPFGPLLKNIPILILTLLLLLIDCEK